RVIFNVVNFSKTKSLYRDGMSPVVKSTSRPKWQRLPAKNVYYYRSPDHRRNYVMSFAFCFDREDEVYQFAYCYPYTYSRLQHYLNSLERRNLPFLQREQLGLSVQQRRLDLLTITNMGKSLSLLTSLYPQCTSLHQHPSTTDVKPHCDAPTGNPASVYLNVFHVASYRSDRNMPCVSCEPTFQILKAREESQGVDELIGS
ncbi:cytosolic carboxypeptidase 6-like, partial [Gymnodraco acuticeps]|uniref:Cytosolic carboxypeptidase 6-like n=1 Tax=Gymnodraco acuticeps TaxID=8218 RepID=A0A6P8TIT2_GYMAC